VSGQVSYLLDTNILSETRKPKADPGVIAFLQSAAPTSVFISVLTIGELRKGIVSKKLKERTPNAAKHLTAWVEGLEASFADRILGIDAATARLWGDIGPASGQGLWSIRCSQPPPCAMNSHWLRGISATCAAFR